MMKDSGFRIRIEKELREKFLYACRKEDRPAAQVLREFMREYIEKHEDATTDVSKKRECL